MKKEDTILMKNPHEGYSHMRETVIENLKKEGIKSTLSKILKNIKYKIMGIDFSTQELKNLDIKSENKKYATICSSSAQKTVDHVLATLLSFDDNLTKTGFIDIGSGKGKLLLKAYEFGFRNLEGVEFSYELCEISKKNLHRLNIKNVKINHIDATDFIFPKDSGVIYFLNPFGDTVFRKVLSNIVNQRKDFVHDLYIVYRAPVFNDIFSEFPDFLHIKDDLFEGDLTSFYLLKRENDE